MFLENRRANQCLALDKLSYLSTVKRGRGGEGEGGLGDREG